MRVTSSCVSDMAPLCSKLRTGSRTILHYPDHDSPWQNSGMDIRERIRQVIDQNPEMTVRSASLAAGLSDSALHKFLTGATESLTLKSVDKLADALGVDARWLAYGEGDPEPASDIGDLWAKLTEDDRKTARRVIEGFARTGTDG